MKFWLPAFLTLPILVAPLVGARIEISLLGAVVSGAAVAPLVGARIEIQTVVAQLGTSTVAPLVGARIEMPRHLKS